MSSHTKGEWWFDDYSYVWALDKKIGDQMISDNPVEDENAYIARMRGIGRGAFDTGEAQANARLIAAAPNLLELAELIIDYCEQHRKQCLPIPHTLQLIEKQATNAVAKAKGEKINERKF